MKTTVQSTDNQLVKSFQQGDNSALEILVNRYKDKVFTSISILVKDKYLAEDIFQHVFIKIIDALRANRYNEEGKFLPWAVRIAQSLCLDHFRNVKRKPAITTSNDRDIFEEIDVAETSADSAMMKDDTHESIRQMVDHLPAEQREVIVLRHYAQLGFKEIAEMTGCSINIVLSRMRHGLQNMQKATWEKQVAL